MLDFASLTPAFLFWPLYLRGHRLRGVIFSEEAKARKLVLWLGGGGDPHGGRFQVDFISLPLLVLVTAFCAHHRDREPHLSTERGCPGPSLGQRLFPP